jgi:hypothetical protein
MSAELAVIPPKPLTPVERASLVFAGVKTEQELRDLAKSSVTILTITNQDGYQQCHAARMALKNVRLEIARTGEEGREDAVQTSKAIIARQKALIALVSPEEDRLQKIQDAWDTRIAAEKEAKIQAEIVRVKKIEERIAELRGCQTLTPASGSKLIAERIADLEAIPVDTTFEEFLQAADDAKTAALKRLGDLHAAALAHEAKERKLEEDRKELERLRAEDIERQRIAAEERAKQEAADKARRDAEDAARAEVLRKQREENDRRAAEQAEELRKQELEAQARRDAEDAAAEANRRRNEAALQEIQAIQHQVIIADTGRAPYCKGGDLESIDWVLAGTEEWEITEEKFGILFTAAVKAKDTTLATLRQKRADLVTRLENAAQAQRLADQQAEIDRQQEELRRAKEPSPAVVEQSIADDAPTMEVRPQAYWVTDSLGDWTIAYVGSDGEQLVVGTVWDNEEEAAGVCDLMNTAFEAGRASATPKAD